MNKLLACILLLGCLAFAVQAETQSDPPPKKPKVAPAKNIIPGIWGGGKWINVQRNLLMMSGINYDATRFTVKFVYRPGATFPKW